MHTSKGYKSPLIDWVATNFPIGHVISSLSSGGTFTFLGSSSFGALLEWDTRPMQPCSSGQRIQKRLVVLHSTLALLFSLGTWGTEQELRHIGGRMETMGPGTSPLSTSPFSGHRCVICMLDFVYGDPIRFLPCLHIYHVDCIDSWLMRSFTCPSCMEPVDAALLASYETN
uniref:RING-type domain-containing protein n=1 Tax=Pelusios castaneus TaxID=367368 RepID=A0A8C8SQV4_9SAUR